MMTMRINHDDFYEDEDDDNEGGVSVDYHCFGDSLSELGCSQW